LVFVTRKSHFNAAHRLHNPHKSDEWNEKRYGKCNHENWHGHNYELEVTVAGTPDPETGYVIDLGELKQIINDEIIEVCDHKNLNMDVDFLNDIIPSTENLVSAFYEQLKSPVEKACHSDGVLHSVRLYETKHNYATYSPYSNNIQ